MAYPDRVAAHAAALQPTRILLSVLASPFYVLGFVLGLLLTLLAWAWSAVSVGISDARGVNDAG